MCLRRAVVAEEQREYVVKLSPWMLSVATFVTTIALCSVYAARQFLLPAVDSNASRVAAASGGTSTDSVDQTLAETGPRLTMVPVLLTDLQPGSTIKPEYVGEAPMHRSKIAAYSDTVLTRDALIGRTARQKIAAATVLRLSMFYPLDRKPDVRIPPDLRLVSLIMTNQRGLVGRFLQTGSYVDVLLTESGTADSGVTARKLFDGVRVFCVTELSPAEFEVLLELTCEQQLALQLAKQRGQLSLTYNPSGPGREGLSLSPQGGTIIHSGDLFTNTSEKRAPRQTESAGRKTEQSFTSEHFRDGERTQTTFNTATDRRN